VIDVRLLTDDDRDRVDAVLPLSRLDARGEYLVAWVDGEPVGHAFVAPPGRSLRFPELPELQDVWVQPERRRQGVATALSRAAEAEVAARGFDRLVLSVGEDNAPAWKLYEGLGFVDTKVEPVRVRGPITIRGRDVHVDDTLHFLVKQLRRFGGQSATATLQRVLVRPPRAGELSTWREYGWRSAPDAAAIAAEHDAFAEQLTGTGAEVVRSSEPVAGDPDAIYACDPVLIANNGAILLRPGKPGRRGEPDALETTLAAAGVPIAARLESPATAEGGDMFWLDATTLVVGRSYRTNDAGIDALRDALPSVEVLTYDLPHLHGAGEILHLLSLLSPLADDLVVSYLPLMPARLVELLRERGVEIVEVPEEEFESMGPNVLALAPRVAQMLARNVETRRRLEAAGVEVLIYEGRELAKGDGGPTCLTLPLLRG
jgi:N-dimethylarginine dimethylaminohydrolase/GNAT superfamily N-acetyltransferase